METFSLLVPSSAFMHGSKTNLGGNMDEWSNDILVYIIYKAATAELKEHSSITSTLSEKPRFVINIHHHHKLIIIVFSYNVRSKKDPLKIVSNWQNILLTQSPSSWLSSLSDVSSDVPNVYKTTCAILATGFTLILEKEHLMEFFPNLVRYMKYVM